MGKVDARRQTPDASKGGRQLSRVAASRRFHWRLASGVWRLGAQRPGFTLIELLVALTLLAVIAGGMTMAFGTSLRAAGSIRTLAERSDVQRALVARLKADLQGCWVRPGSETTWFRGVDATGAGGASAGSRGDVLDLTTARLVSPEVLLADPMTAPLTWPAAGSDTDRAALPQSDVAQVSWQLEPDASGALALVRRERTPPDPEVEIALDPAVVPRVIAPGITDFNVRYFDGVDWQDAWDTAAALAPGEDEAPTTGLPRAVEVTLSLGGGARRRGVEETMGRAGEDEPRITLVVALPDDETASLLATEGTRPAGGAP
jgi:prepilin-type N-terminal cleavage/methylation domain-containing protein